jgi:hypothetical protein
MTKTYAQALREFQMQLLVDALAKAKGNVCEAALALDIHRNTFSRILYDACSLTPAKVCALLKEQGLIPPRELPQRQMLQKSHPRTIRTRAA